MHKWKIKPLAWLPNRSGFQFTGILKNGREVACHIERDPVTQCHKVSGGATLQELTGWK